LRSRNYFTIMSDIDFITDLTDGGFSISLTDSPQAISGNRALVNRFELTFLTKTKIFLEGETALVDNYGGNAERFINKPHVLSDIQGISAAISTAVSQTVVSMKSDEPKSVPNTERINSATLDGVDVIDDIIYARIRITPVDVEDFGLLTFNMPITRV